jgi:hypothetical protein
MAIRGSCLCGGVRFEIDQAVGPFEICHCNRCRKVSGSSGMAAIGVRTRDYRLLCGDALIRVYDAPVLNEPPAYRCHFCSTCGSPVPDPHPSGDWFEIPAGLLDDDPGIKPDKHIFVELLPPWDSITDGLPALTVRELLRERYGREPAADYRPRTHHDV